MKDRKFKRVICIYNGSIVSYCIVYFKLRPWEKVRYDEAKMFLEDKDVCTIAPCVLEEYQHKGVGSAMFEHITKIAKAYDKKIIILWGGVITKNHPAVNYYKKMNLKILKKWFHPLSKIMCYDMYLNV